MMRYEPGLAPLEQPPQLDVAIGIGPDAERTASRSTVGHGEPDQQPSAAASPLGNANDANGSTASSARNQES